MNKEIEKYFKKRYYQSSFRVVPGHWPDFKTKKEVDRWIKFNETLMTEINEIAKQKKQV